VFQGADGSAVVIAGPGAAAALMMVHLAALFVGVLLARRSGQTFWYARLGAMPMPRRGQYSASVDSPPPGPVPDLPDQTRSCPTRLSCGPARRCDYPAARAVPLDRALDAACPARAIVTSEPRVRRRRGKGCVQESCLPGSCIPSSCASTAGRGQRGSGSAARAPRRYAGPGACPAARDWTAIAA